MPDTKKQLVIYQGTFDPFTNGHLAVLQEALRIFGRVRILLLINPDKKPLFCLQERRDMIVSSVAHLSGVDIDSDSGLLADYMRARGLEICVRGIRNAEDAAYEMNNHHLSRGVYPRLQTLLLPCESCWEQVSSSAVKSACESGRLPKAWVPFPVAEKLKRKFPDLVLV